MAKRKSDMELLWDLCRSLPGVTEDVKWGNDLVFSVGEKMFAAFELPDGLPIGLKVAPELFPVLTRKKGITPAPYMAKHFWVKVDSLGVMPREALRDLLRDAHRLTAMKLSGRKRRELGIDD